MTMAEDDVRLTAYAMAGIYTFGGFSINDEKNQTGDRLTINLSEDGRGRGWSQKYGVSEQPLRAAVGKVGNIPADVERPLKGR